MTTQVISTTEVNLILRKANPSYYFSKKTLTEMGFKPIFETSVGAYWDKTIPSMVQKIIDAKKTEAPKALEDSTYEKGYAAGYRARAKKEWRTVSDNEAADLIQGAYANDEFIMDIGWLLHTYGELLKAKNHG